MLEGVDLQPACGALKQCPVVIPSNANEMMTVVAIQLKVSEKNWRTCIAFQIFWIRIKILETRTRRDHRRAAMKNFEPYEISPSIKGLNMFSIAVGFSRSCILYRIDLLLSILSYVHIVYFHSLFLKSVSKRWHIHDILRNITSFHLNWCVSWGSWPISLPWISIPERWQIELPMFFCRFAQLILKNFFSGGIVELIKMVQEVTW